MTDLTQTIITREGIRLPLLESLHLRSILDDEIDYFGDLNLAGLKDEPAIEMED